MNRKELLAEILKLSIEDRRRLVCEVVKSLRGAEPGDDIEPELREEWRRQHEEMLDRILIKVL